MLVLVREVLLWIPIIATGMTAIAGLAGIRAIVGRATGRITIAAGIVTEIMIVIATIAAKQYQAVALPNDRGCVSLFLGMAAPPVVALLQIATVRSRYSPRQASYAYTQE